MNRQAATLLIGTNLLVYFVLKLCWIAGFTQWVDFAVDITALPAAPLAAATHPWALLTYAFLHLDFLHLAVNMLWLAWMCQLLSSVSSRRLFALYAAGAIAGAAMYLLTGIAIDGNANSRLIGSSSAVMALIAYAIAVEPSRIVTFPALGSIRICWIAVGAALMVAIEAYSQPLTTTAAHLGGIAVGVVAAIATLRRQHTINFSESPHPDGSILSKVRTSGYASLTAEERKALFSGTPTQSPTK